MRAARVLSVMASTEEGTEGRWKNFVRRMLLLGQQSLGDLVLRVMVLNSTAGSSTGNGSGSRGSSSSSNDDDDNSEIRMLQSDSVLSTMACLESELCAIDSGFECVLPSKHIPVLRQNELSTLSDDARIMIMRRMKV